MTPDELLDVLRAGADVGYGGPLSVLEHSVQVAMLALEDHAPPALVVAALFHDVGRLPGIGTPDTHARDGADWLAAQFGPAVSEPVRLHVRAQRALVGMEPGYFNGLHPLLQQLVTAAGGAMSEPEIERFLALDHAHEAVHLRRWDDRAHGHTELPPLELFLDLIEEALAEPT